MSILETLGIEKVCLRTIKAIYNKLTANIKLNKDKLGIYPLKTITRERDPLCPLLFNIVLKALAITIRPTEDQWEENRKGNCQIIYISILYNFYTLRSY